tara:strand:+ start:389 stop:907 length:519 start_codon:yes stop_codon:yes gene_type:complete
MDFQFYLEKLYASDDFKKFKQENKDAFLFSGFFVKDFSKGKVEEDRQHFDFYVPSLKKAFSFMVEEGGKKMEIEKIIGVPAKVGDGYSFDLDKIKEIIEVRMDKEKIGKKIQKVLLSLQNPGKPDKDFLVGTVFIGGMGIIKVKFSLPDLEILDFEKKSFLDMVSVFKKKKD